jgi:RNA polymerase sigma-70 factor (ECF subfamily)
VFRVPSIPASVASAPAARVAYHPSSVSDAAPPPLPRAALAHIDALYRLARRLTGDEDVAHDLVQDTYARAFAARHQFEAGTNVKAWLFRILRNCAIDRLRRDRRGPDQTVFDDEEGRDDAGAREPLRGDPELERLRAVVAEDIEAALAALSIDARTIVLLDLEGLTESELAEVLGCSQGTVKSRLSRARAKLRQQLRDYAR